jgi:hypothetical protein
LQSCVDSGSENANDNLLVFVECVTHPIKAHLCIECIR